jgi:hypothetical protein
MAKAFSVHTIIREDEEDISFPPPEVAPERLHDGII